MASSSFAVICLLLQKCVHVLAGLEDIAVFPKRTAKDGTCITPTAEIKGQISPMTKLGIGLTIRYVPLLLMLHACL